MEPEPHHSVTVRQGDIARSQRWPLSFLRKVVRTTLRLAPCPEDAEVCLTLTNDCIMRHLNLHYRDQDRPTDVLAFALEEGQAMQLPPGMPRQLGDVVVSVETTLRQAYEHASSPESELAWVICHGVLHLLGYDHQDEAQLRRMREREQAVLAALAIEREWPQPVAR